MSGRVFLSFFFSFFAFCILGVGWENDMKQTECLGNLNEKAPFSFNNHVAKCGFINKFDFGSNTCEINHF